MKLPLPDLWFTRDEWFFSLKCFAAAMLAMFLANWAGQPRPFWALMATYVVANPLAGAVRSKALFRLLGTFIGSTATVLLVPWLINSPELLSLALAAWVAVCLFYSLLDRTPRSYVFMLSGYTAALVGFPAVETPAQIFDIAVSRVEEIGLGILAASVVHSVVLPKSMTTTVLGLLDRTLGDTRQWLQDLMQPTRHHSDSLQGQLGSDRRRVAADLTQLRLLSTLIPFDTTNLRWTGATVHAMQDRVATLMPVLSAIEDRLEALEDAEGELAPSIQALLVRMGGWLQATSAAPLAELQALRAAVHDLAQPAADTPVIAPWNMALRIALATRLEELLSGWHACLNLRQDIEHGVHTSTVPPQPERTQGQILHLDVGMAALSGLAAFVAIGTCCLFWILTGWPMGSAAAMMAAIFCCFFATQDDPVPAIHNFLKGTLWSMPISAVYVLVLMPLAQDFPSLVVVLAPFFLLMGAFMGRPTTAVAAVPVLFGVIGILALHDTTTIDVQGFLNSMLGQLAGLLAASRATRLFRSVGADWSARRIQRATWRDLDELARSPRAHAQGEAYTLRMLDRLALLAPRVAQAGGSIEGVPTDDALHDLRLGADIVALQRHRAPLPLGPWRRLMRDLAQWLRLRSANHLAPPPEALLTRIDQLLASALNRWAHPASAEQDPRVAISALVGLRRNLYPHAAPGTLLQPLPSGA